MSTPSQSLRQRAKLHLRHFAIGICDRLLRFCSKPLVVREESAVIIAPHQDDESLGCGGLIARRRNDGLPVHVIFITDGAASHRNHPRVNSRELSHLRHQEAMQAMARLGVERTAVHFLEEPDGTLNTISPSNRLSLVNRLAGLFIALSPSEVFLPCNPDGSSEHDATFGFVTDALIHTKLRPALWQYPVWSWWNPVLLLRCWIAAKDCRRLPLEDFHQSKMRAIDCYQSQINPIAPDTTPALPPELVRIFKKNTEIFFRYELPEKKTDGANFTIV